MSISVNYSKFGTSLSDTSLESLRGEPGFGFAVDEFGNYDIQGNCMVDIDCLDVRGDITNDTPGNVSFGSNVDMGTNNIIGVNDINIANDIVYSSPETNNTLVTVLARDSGDGNKIKETDLSNLPLDNISVNSISQKDNGFIQVNDDTVFSTTSVKLTSVAGQESITANNCFHLQSDGDACLYIQADRDGTGGADNPVFLANTSGGLYGSAIVMSNTGGRLQIANGSTADATSGDIQFFTTQITDNGDAPFTLGGSQLLFEIKNSENDSYRNLNLNTNNIVNVNDLDAKGIIVNSDNTPIKSASHQLHLQDDNGDVRLFLESSGTGGDTYIDMNQQNGEVASQISHRWGPVSCMEYRVGQVADKWGMHQFYVSRTNNVSKGTMNSFTTDYLMMEIGGSGSLNIDMYYPVNFRNQALSNVGSLAFQTIPTTDNTNTNLLTVDGSGNVEVRTVASLPVANPFDQSLNIADDVVFGDVVAQGQMKVMNGVTDNNIYTDGLHVVSNSTAEIYLESSKNELGSTKTQIIGYHKSATASNQRGFLVGHGTTNTMRFLAGNDAGQNNADFLFSSAQTFDNGDFIPTFGTETNIMRLQTSEIDSFTNLDMNNNQINNISSLSFQTTPTNDDTENRLLVLNTANDVVEYRNVSSLPFINSNQGVDTTDDVTFNKIDITNPTLNNSSFSFAMYNATSDEIEYRTDFADQSVNTTDNVEFADVKASTISGGTSGTAMTISADSTNIDIPSGTVLDINGFIELQQVPAEPLTAPTNAYRLYTRLGSVKVKDDANIEYDLINNFNQELNTTDNVTHNDVTVSNALNLTGTIPTSTVSDYLVLDGTSVRTRSNVFGDYYTENQSLTVSSTTSTTYGGSKVLVSPGSVVAGDYVISWYCELTNSNKNNNTYARIELNNTTTLAETTTPQLLLAEDYVTFSGSVVVTLGAITPLIELDYRAGATTARIKNAHLQFYRVG